MRKYVITCIVPLLFHTVAYAQTYSLNYRATFGIFGTVGMIRNRLELKGNRYQIDTTVTLAGMAKMIMGGQTEHYLSRGHMENGLMVTDYYKMVSRKKSKTVTKEYIVDHQAHRVTKKYKRVKHGKVERDTVQQLDFYAKDDLLTLYFNMDKHIRNHPKAHHFMLKAVGL
jgi:hypothetical protein